MGRETRIGATIRRAQRQARNELLGHGGLLTGRLDRLEALYESALLDIQAAISRAAAGGDRISLDALAGLRRSIEARLGLLSEARNHLLDEGLQEGASLAANTWGEIPGLPRSVQGITDEALSFVREFVAEDGLQLSDRLWRLDRNARTSVIDSIESAIIQGDSAERAALQFLARGESVPEEYIRKANFASPETLRGRTAEQLMTGAGTAYRDAVRVFRMEIIRAHGQAFRAAMEAHPDCVGVRFVLSPRHPRVDICDMHATVNRYGMGQGVYPHGRSPWPAHPETYSYEEPVFADEITDEDRTGQEDRIAWLKRQPGQIQLGVLDSQMKRAALLKGLLKENQIATTWKALKRRLERQGITARDLVSGIAPPIPPAPVPLPAGAPVSEAFAVHTLNKQVREALEAIDAVHGDGELPVLPILRTTSNRYNGYFKHQVNGPRRPKEIRLRHGTGQEQHTLTHEIGHFLDHQTLGLRGHFASRSPEFMQEWREAVHASKAVKHLRSLYNGPSRVKVLGVELNIPKRYISYLLSDHEIWARSYAQWIALRSPSKTLRQQLDNILGKIATEPIQYTRQWDWEDFEPIARAIDDLFRRLGWLKPGNDT